MNHKKPAGLLLRGLLEFALLFGVTAAGAADLPAYYPSEGFQRTVRIDALVPEEQRIIVNDISYTLADNVIVHTPTTFSVPRTSLRVGDRIAYRLGGNQLIVEIWTVPGDDNDQQR
jgi:hypothetical protein